MPVAARRGVVPRALAAQADGFEHIDPMVGTDPASLVLPIGCPTAHSQSRNPEWCATPAPVATEGMWDTQCDGGRLRPARCSNRGREQQS